MMTKTKRVKRSTVALVLAVLMLCSLLSCAFGATAATYDGRNRVGCWWWFIQDATKESTREE